MIPRPRGTRSSRRAGYGEHRKIRFASTNMSRRRPITAHGSEETVRTRRLSRGGDLAVPTPTWHFAPSLEPSPAGCPWRAPPAPAISPATATSTRPRREQGRQGRQGGKGGSRRLVGQCRHERKLGHRRHASGDPAVAGVLPVTRSARLTHAQYQAAMLELFGIEDSPSASFAPDATNGFEFDNRLDLRVDARLGPQYRAAAETVAARVAGDAALLARIVPCDAAEAGCADELSSRASGAARFADRSRPMRPSRFGALFARGPSSSRAATRSQTACGSSSKPCCSRRSSCIATSSAPKRTPTGSSLSTTGKSRRASRSSCGTRFPDAALLDAAERGELSRRRRRASGRVAPARRSESARHERLAFTRRRGNSVASRASRRTATRTRTRPRTW